MFIIIFNLFLLLILFKKYSPSLFIYLKYYTELTSECHDFRLPVMYSVHFLHIPSSPVCVSTCLLLREGSQQKFSLKPWLEGGRDNEVATRLQPDSERDLSLVDEGL